MNGTVGELGFQMTGKAVVCLVEVPFSVAKS